MIIQKPTPSMELSLEEEKMRFHSRAGGPGSSREVHGVVVESTDSRVFSVVSPLIMYVCFVLYRFNFNLDVNHFIKSTRIILTHPW